MGMEKAEWVLTNYDFTEFCLLYFFFFFQAEDGIRDWSVTGVQTCALPISVGQPDPDASGAAPGIAVGHDPVEADDRMGQPDKADDDAGKKDRKSVV